jgi:hypothetical protein
MVFPALVVTAEWFTAIVMFNIHKKTKLGKSEGNDKSNYTIPNTTISVAF